MTGTKKLTTHNSLEPAGDPAFQTELLNMAWEDGDSAGIAHALSVIAKARGMTETADKAGITRQALYKALSEGGNPTLSSLLGIMSALGVKAHFDLGEGRGLTSA